MLDRITTALIIGACVTLLTAALGQVMPVIPAMLAVAAVGTACATEHHADDSDAGMPREPVEARLPEIAGIDPEEVTGSAVDI